MKTLLYSNLKFSLLLLLGVAAMSPSYAQPDTTDYEILDVVYLKEGGAKFGEIVAFDAATGGLVFKDKLGRTFSFAREDYNYFVEDQKFKTKAKRAKDRAAALRQRKDNDWELSVGMSATYLNASESLETDEYYIQGGDGTSDLPACVEIGVGKYFGAKHFLGFSADLPTLSPGINYFAAGLRYAFQYDNKKSNLALFLPAEFKFISYKSSLYYGVADTTFSDGGLSWEYPSTFQPELTLTAIAISVGHGFAYILKNRHSVSLDIAFVNHLILSQAFEKLEARKEPKTSFSAVGLKAGIRFNF